MAKLNRRHFVAGLTAVLGATGYAYLNRHAIEVGQSYTPGGENEFFSEAHMKLLSRFVDIIIPETDTPGASQAGVHHYIDHMAGSWMNDKESPLILRAVEALDQAANKSHGKDFMSLEGDAQVAIVQNMDDNRQTNKAYNMLKSYTVTGYYTSELGASEELIYDPIPGEYREVLFSEVGRVSAT